MATATGETEQTDGENVAGKRLSTCRSVPRSDSCVSGRVMRERYNGGKRVKRLSTDRILFKTTQMQGFDFQIFFQSQNRSLAAQSRFLDAAERGDG